MIRIIYQLRCESRPRSIELSPDDYFDPLDPGENYEANGIPRWDHAYQYTGHTADEVKWTVLENGPKKGSIVRTQFLDGRRSMMTHRADADGYEAIIHFTAIGEAGLLIVRTVKQPGQAWAVVMSNYSINHSIGESKQVGWSFEEMQAFCNIGVRGKALVAADRPQN
jgi:hypothetical protein